MKSRQYETICRTLLERFGEPLETSKPRRSQRRVEEGGMCVQCRGGYMEENMDEDERHHLDPEMYSGIHDRPQADHSRGHDGSFEPGSEIEMQSLGGGHVGGSGHASVEGWDDDVDEMDELDEMDDDLDEVTPPGGEKVVKALKKRKGVKNPWAVAWSMKKKGEF